MTAPDNLDGLHPGLYDIRSGRIHRNDDGTLDADTTVHVKPRRPPGARLIGGAGWLLAALAAGVLGVSYAGQFAYIYAARHQVIPANIEAGMFDVGMVIFALLGLGLALASRPARVERALVMVCAFGSAAMNYAAADTTSPRSVLAYVAPPLFLAAVVDRVIAVVRRHRIGDTETSPWAPLGRAALTAARAGGLTLLYGLRLTLDPPATARGLRQFVLDAAPLPAPPGGPPAIGMSKKARLLAAYRDHPGYGDRTAVARIARELAPDADLQEGTARTYLYAHLDTRTGS